MSDIFKCVEKLLNDNGVRVDVEELQPNHLNDDMRCVRIEKKILTLDFTEHDKVFEDKIAKLVKENAKVYQENMHLEEQCVKKEDEIYKLKIENQELKQRIAELESKETKKPINGWICVKAKEINGQEYVKLEDFLQVVNDLQAEIGT